MTAEVKGAEPQTDPVALNRKSFNAELFARQYTGSRLMNRAVELQRALLASNLPPEQAYHEISIVFGQSGDRSEASNDLEMASAFRGIQETARLTYEKLTGETTATATKTTPTDLDTLPPMTAPKGLETTKNPTIPKPATTETNSAYVTREQQVLNALKEEEKPISKEDLAKKLGASANSVGTYISKLRKAGHKIDLSTEEGAWGYKLIEPEQAEDSEQATQNPQDAN